MSDKMSAPSVTEFLKQWNSVESRPVIDVARDMVKEWEAQPQPAGDKMREALEAVKYWAGSQCPCVDGEPDPCSLCGARADKDVCKALDGTLPAKLIGQIDAALAQSRPDSDVAEGREDMALLAHEIDSARKAYLDGFKQERNAERKAKLEQLLWDDIVTIIQALRAASATPPAAAGREETEDDAGIDFALEQLCAFLGVDLKSVTWDAATETRDGDVQAVIGNILRAKFGEDFDPAVSPQDEKTGEPFALIDERLADLRKTNDVFRGMDWDKSSDIQRNDREIRWLLDLRSILRCPTGSLKPLYIKRFRTLIMVGDSIKDEVKTLLDGPALPRADGGAK